jgi:hypothetical protein
MTASWSGQLPFPYGEPTCPSCEAGHALARGMRIGYGITTMTYACDHCEHRWDVSGSDPDKPKLSLSSLRTEAGGESRDSRGIPDAGS